MLFGWAFGQRYRLAAVATRQRIGACHEIIAGRFRGLTLASLPKGSQDWLRPTRDRVKETLFQLLSHGAKVADHLPRWPTAWWPIWPVAVAIRASRPCRGAPRMWC
jgi:hypothetical protein